MLGKLNSIQLSHLCYSLEIEVAIGKFSRYKLPDVDQIPAELTQAGRKTLCSEIHKLIKLIWNKNLPHQ
jgi:hypothetical protein